MAEKTKTPEKFNVAISPTVAKKFRAYCAKKHLIMSKVVEELLSEYLIQQGEVSSWVALDNERLESGEKI